MNEVNATRDVRRRELEREFAEFNATAHRDALASLDDLELAALALPPLMTTRALRQVTTDVPGLLARARPLLRSPALLDDDDQLELTPEADRAIDERLIGSGGARNDVVRSIRDVGERIAGLDKTPPLLGRWVELARELDRGPEAVARRILHQVRAACDAGAAGTVLDLVEAAASLGAILGEPIASAVRVARHRITREYRTRPERHLLDKLVPRHAALAAFDTLLDGKQGWALHYVGVGGAGKTSLIRRIALQLAQEKGLSVARIDFDYLSPRFPARDPGQLIEAIVHELAAAIDSESQDRWFRKVNEQLERVRSIARELDPQDPLGPVGWDEYTELIGLTASFLRDLPRPLIVLDTCEELTKLDPVASGLIPSVEATFYLIERLRQSDPPLLDLRVLFAGRRLLCHGGVGWQAHDVPPGVVLSAPRDYLAIHEVRGFDDAEADQLIDRVVPAERRDRGELVAEIKKLCPETVRVNWLDDHDDGGPRYAPFELVTYAEWVRGDDAIDVATLRRGDLDPYVEQRIVKRMGPLRSYLPLVALLRRFDLATLAAALDQSPAQTKPVFEALSSHEWLRPHDEAGRGSVLEVKRGLDARLENWLRKVEADEWGAACVRVGERLGARLRAIGLIDAPKDLVDAVMRALPDLEAAGLWLALERGIGKDQSTAVELTRFVMSDRAAAERDDTLLGAAVRATRASALINTQPEVDVIGQWQAVLTVAEAIGEGALAREAADLVWRLSMRARLGLVAARAWANNEAEESTAAIEETIRWGREREFETSIIAAIEALIEHAERNPPGTPLIRLTEIVEKLEPSTPGLAAFVTLLRVRLMMVGFEADVVSGPIDQLHDNQGDLLRDLLATKDWTLPEVTLDWRPPRSLPWRVRLEALRLRFWEADSFAWLDDWEAALERVEHDDQAHLAVAIAMRRAAAAPLPSVRREVLAWQSRSLGRVPCCYRRFAPAVLRVAAARDGLIPLDDPLLDAAEALRARAAWARRHRDPSVLKDLRAAATQADEASLVTLNRASAVATGVSLGPRQLDVSEPAVAALIEHWSYQIAWSRDEVENLMFWLRGRVPTLVTETEGELTIERARLGAMLEEILELSRYTSDPIIHGLKDWIDRIESVHPDRTEDMARLALRKLAAGKPPRWIAAVLADTPRRLAELALEEAELLALRLPERAEKLYEHAADAFQECGDTDGWLASLIGSAYCGWQLRGDFGQELIQRLEDLTLFGRTQRSFALPMPLPFVPAVLERFLPAAGEVGMARKLHAGNTLPYGTTRIDLEPRLRRIDRGPRTSPSPLRRARTWAARNQWLVGGAPVLIGLIVGAIWLLRYAALRWIAPLLEKLDWVPHSISGYVAFSVLVAALYFGSAALEVPDDILAWWNNRKLRRLRPRAVLTSVGPTQAELRVVTRGDDLGVETLSVPPPGVWPEIETRKDGALAPLHGLFGVQRTTLEIQIAPELQRHAWERAFKAAYPTVRARYVRTVKAKQSTGTPAPQLVFFGPPPLAQEWVLEGKTMPDADRALAGVAHVIGRPVRDVGTIRLDSGQGSRSRRAALLPSELVPAGTPVVIVQGDPGGALALPTEASRIETSQLRELAVAIIEQGADAAIVIPSVMESTARIVIRQLAESLASPARRDADRVIEVADLVRARLHAIEDEAHAAAELEVTVFIRTSPNRS